MEIAEYKSELLTFDIKYKFIIKISMRALR